MSSTRSNATFHPSQQRDSRSFVPQRPQSQYSAVSPINDPYAGDAEEFDVRADFDGRGTRWSQMYGADAWPETSDAKGYLPVDVHDAPSGSTRPQARQSMMSGADASKDEMVSVPVLGPDWQKSELHDLSRRGKSEIRQERRVRAWREWKRDQRGLFGVRWLTRKALVFSLFAICVALAVTLFFTIPRAPSFAFYANEPFTVNNSTVEFSRTPTNFSFSGNLNLLADASNSYLPVHFSNIQVTLFDLDNDKAIATGAYGNHIIAKKANQAVVLPVQFSYSALNASDPTWNDMYSACGHDWPGTVRPDLKFRLELRMSIIGLVSHPFSETQISGVACPFELPADSV